MVTSAEPSRLDNQQTTSVVRQPHRWKKGESGNPRGRPKLGLTIPESLRSLGNQPSDIPGMTRFEKLMAGVYELAERGEEWAIKFISERTEGRVADRVEVKDVTYPTIRIECADDNDQTPPQAA